MNEKHYIKVEIPELDFTDYLGLLWDFSENKCNLSKEDHRKFEGLCKIFMETFEKMK